MSDEHATRTTRIAPLNLSEEEAEYLWEMMKREIGKEEVWDQGDDEVVRSMHTKVRRVVKDDDE